MDNLDRIGAEVICQITQQQTYGASELARMLAERLIDKCQPADHLEGDPTYTSEQIEKTLRGIFQNETITVYANKN